MITFQYEDKKPQMISDDHPRFDDIVQLIMKDEDYASAYDLCDLKAVVTSAILGSNLELKGNDLYYKDEVVDGLLGQRILEIHRLGLSVDSLVAFLDNLMDNPSSRAVGELYGFLESSRLPITDDGCFLAYKAVNMDYTDKHSGTINNGVGQVVSMPRNKVSDNKDDTCSFGLHFAAHEYASDFGGSGSRMMIMKINPRDVVSIPSDYNNQKGRCCEYTVYQEVERDDKGLIGAQVVDTGTKVIPGTIGDKGLSLGDRVVITEQGHSKYLGDFSNPRGVVGVLVYPLYASGTFIYRVQWDEGYTNSYEEGDLRLAEDTDETDVTKDTPATYVPQTDNYDDRGVFTFYDEFIGKADEFPVNRKSTYDLDRINPSKEYGDHWFFTAYDVGHDNLVFRKHNGVDWDYVTIADTDNWDIYVTKEVLGS